jgi:hypothetical protein
MMSYTKEYRKFVALLCALFMLVPDVVLAADINFPVACYQGDELAKVREWEKTFVGKKINAANVDQVKEFLPESFYNLMKDTKRWGDWWFVIAPYQEVPYSPGYIKATKEYNGQSKIDDNGEIVNWTAGVPFPDTKDNALQMAHNFRCRNFGDGYKNQDTGYIIDGKLKYDMSLGVQNNLNFVSGRVDTPPIPSYPDNPKQMWRAFTMLQLAPPETRNMRIMEINYNDRMKPYDSWYWMPSIRRIRRRSTTERQDAQGGGDYCAFDNMGWDGPISLNTYKYLGAKEYLMGRHNDSAKLEHQPGECLWKGTQRERIKLQVIEAKNKDPNFIYSKMIWYLDPESWQMLYADKYDRQGRLWKVQDQIGFVGKGYQGVPITHFNTGQMIDVQRTHSTMAISTFDFGQQFPMDMFTLDYLQKHGY